MNTFSLLLLPLFIIFCVVFITIFNIMLFRDEISQVMVGFDSNPLAVLVQITGQLLISVITKPLLKIVTLRISYCC
jgi:hypothetical protein